MDQLSEAWCFELRASNFSQSRLPAQLGWALVVCVVSDLGFIQLRRAQGFKSRGSPDE